MGSQYDINRERLDCFGVGVGRRNEMDGVFRGWVQRVKAIIYVFPFLQQLDVQIYIRVSLWWVGGIQGIFGEH